MAHRDLTIFGMRFKWNKATGRWRIKGTRIAEVYPPPNNQRLHGRDWGFVCPNLLCGGPTGEGKAGRKRAFQEAVWSATSPRRRPSMMARLLAHCH